MQSAEYVLLRTTDASTTIKVQMVTNTTRGDAKSMCGDHAKCLMDRQKILKMHEDSAYTASVYISIILTCYAVGMIILLLHFVKQKYGQVSLYDIYLEVCPSCWTGMDPLPTQAVADDEEDEEDEEDIEEFSRVGSSFRQFRFEFFKRGNKDNNSSMPNGSEQSRKSSSVSSVDANREGRDRRRRNRKKPARRRRTCGGTAAIVICENSFASIRDFDSTSLACLKLSPATPCQQASHLSLNCPIPEAVEPTSPVLTSYPAIQIQMLHTSAQPANGTVSKSDEIPLNVRPSEGESQRQLNPDFCVLKVDPVASTAEFENERRKSGTKETIL